ncbi:MAG: protoporphyrinogen oxidase [Verrucomicrobia bacterium]|nr:protoporphyrinogen oxidase [Verrucomicrobiota bacterium]
MKVAIIGAGIAGLSLAWFLQQNSSTLDISIFDEKERVGGQLYTLEKNGQRYECGPRSLRTKGAGKIILDLIEELGITEEVIEAREESRTRYLVHKGALEPVPSSLYALCSSSLGRMCLKACIKELFIPRGRQDDESVASFFERRFGRSMVSRCIDPLTYGIYGADPHSLSMQSCFGSIYEKEKKFGSVVLGALLSPRQKQSKKQSNVMISFKKGVGFLPQVLASKLCATFHLGTKIDAIVEEASHVLLSSGGKQCAFDALFVAISPQALSTLLPLDQLKAIPQTSLVTVSTGWHDVHALPDAFGFLCPSSEDDKLLGVVFDSRVFPQHNQLFKTRISLMFGGERAPAISCFRDEDLLSLSEDAAIKYLGIKAPFDDAVVFRARDAVARYPVGHAANVDYIEKRLGARITLLGAGFYGVSVGDAIASAKRVATDFLRLQKSDMLI